MATRGATLPTKDRSEEPCPCGCAPCEEPCCSLDCLVRPRFFCGQLLTDQDLTALVTWTQDKLRLTRYRDGWGVVCGLEVRCDPKQEASVVVGPGYAMSCCGDDIVVCEEGPLDVSGACRDQEDPCAEPRPPRPPDEDLGMHAPVSASPYVQVFDPTQVPAQNARPPGLARKGRLPPWTAVDVYVGYTEHDAEPQTALGRSACGEVAGCEYGRAQERSRIWWKAAGREADPVAERAREWARGYAACLGVVRAFRSRFGVNVSRDGREELRWLLDWLGRRPLRQFCTVRSTLCDQRVVTEQAVAEALFWIAQDCRNAYLTCSCFSCDPSHGVPLARVWLRQEEEEGRLSCRVVEIDPYPPYRRNIGLDCWPVLMGQVNLGRFIWHRWEEVCTGLADLGLGGGGFQEVDMPTRIEHVEPLLDCPPFADCGDRPIAQVITDPGGIQRVVGFCGQISKPTQRPPSDTRPPEAPGPSDEEKKREEERARGEGVEEAVSAAKAPVRRQRRTRAPRQTAQPRRRRPTEEQ